MNKDMVDAQRAVVAQPPGGAEQCAERTSTWLKPAASAIMCAHCAMHRGTVIGRARGGAGRQGAGWVGIRGAGHAPKGKKAGSCAHQSKRCGFRVMREIPALRPGRLRDAPAVAAAGRRAQARVRGIYG